MPERISETGTLTTVHLSLIAVLIVLVILAMLWGARLKRQRAAADAIEEKRVEELGGTIPDAAAAHQPLDDTAATDLPRRVDNADQPTRVPAPPPVTPAPPPIADTPVVATPAPAPIAAAVGDGDTPVTQLKGLGPKVAARLAELDITRVGQLAALDEAQAVDLDAQLGAFKGRMVRDRWIEQAQLLAAGDRAGFEAKFGKL